MDKKWLIILVIAFVALVFFMRRESAVKRTGASSKSKDSTLTSTPDGQSVEATISANGKFIPETRTFIGNIPLEKQDVIRKTWMETAGLEGFKSTDFDFSSGLVRAPNGPAVPEQLGVWNDATGACQLEIKMTNFIPQGTGRVNCRW
jgi:hypothetical protein